METDAEKEVQKRLNDFVEASAGSDGVNKAVLAMAALDADTMVARVSEKKKRWAYILSFALPPIGFAFAIWYYYSGKLGSKRTALICVVITVLSLVLAWITLAMFVASIPAGTLEQLQGLKQEDIRSLLE